MVKSFGVEGKYEDLPGGVFSIGQGMAAPTLMTWAKEDDKLRYLPKLASGEEIWCQLFSEPAGGSDLAALRTGLREARDESDLKALAGALGRLVKAVD